MHALMVKTCDGVDLYRDNAAGRLAAIKAVRRQLEQHCEVVFGMDAKEGKDLSKSIGNMPYSGVLDFLIENQLIHRRKLLED